MPVEATTRPADEGAEVEAAAEPEEAAAGFEAEPEAAAAPPDEAAAAGLSEPEAAGAADDPAAPSAAAGEGDEAAPPLGKSVCVRARSQFQSTHADTFWSPALRHEVSEPA